jgi:hypothetical protein
MAKHQETKARRTEFKVSLGVERVSTIRRWHRRLSFHVEKCTALSLLSQGGGAPFLTETAWLWHSTELPSLISYL